MNTGTRSYSMANRADAAEETSRTILEATVELYWRHPIEQITLAMIAEHSDVTVQTVIRKFGSRDDTLTAAAQHARAAVESQRDTADPADGIEQLVAILVEHYEMFGDGVMKLLSEESRLPAIAEIVERGRRLHYEWCERVFAEQLAAVRGARRKRLRLQLIAICDVYTWKLLRRDGGLTQNQTRQAIIEMIAALEGAST